MLCCEYDEILVASEQGRASLHTLLLPAVAASSGPKMAALVNNGCQTYLLLPAVAASSGSKMAALVNNGCQTRFVLRRVLICF